MGLRRDGHVEIIVHVEGRGERKPATTTEATPTTTKAEKVVTPTVEGIGTGFDTFTLLGKLLALGFVGAGIVYVLKKMKER